LITGRFSGSPEVTFEHFRCRRQPNSAPTTKGTSLATDAAARRDVLARVPLAADAREVGATEDSDHCESVGSHDGREKNKLETFVTLNRGTESAPNFARGKLIPFLAVAPN
jgi:hypothetical protein